MAKRMPLLDTAAAASAQQKQLRIIETFIASENSRELKLAQCKSMEKRHMLEMEFALERAHESKLLQRLMQKGESEDRLEEEVHAMVAASSKRLEAIDAAQKLPTSPFVPQRAQQAKRVAKQSKMPLIKRGPKAAAQATKKTSNTSKKTAVATLPAAVYKPNIVKPPKAAPLESTGAPQDKNISQLSFETFFNAFVGSPETLFTKVKEVVLDVDGYEVRVRKKIDERPTTSDATTGVRGVRALKEQLDRLEKAATCRPDQVDPNELENDVEAAAEGQKKSKKARDGHKAKQLHEKIQKTKPNEEETEEINVQRIESTLGDQKPVDDQLQQSYSNNEIGFEAEQINNKAFGSNASLGISSFDDPICGDENWALPPTSEDLIEPNQQMIQKEDDENSPAHDSLHREKPLGEVYESEAQEEPPGEVYESEGQEVVIGDMEKSFSNLTLREAIHNVSVTTVGDIVQNALLHSASVLGTNEDSFECDSILVPSPEKQPLKLQLDTADLIDSANSLNVPEVAAQNIQRVIRGHIGRKQFQKTLYDEAAECGVLGAMPGTTQGTTGWYQEPQTHTAHYFVVLPSGEWKHKVKVQCPRQILSVFDMQRYVHSVINVMDDGEDSGGN